MPLTHDLCFKIQYEMLMRILPPSLCIILCSYYLEITDCIILGELFFFLSFLELKPVGYLEVKKSEQKYKTRVFNDTPNPVWNQTFDFVVEDGLHKLLLYDHDTFGKKL